MKPQETRRHIYNAIGGAALMGLAAFSSGCDKSPTTPIQASTPFTQAEHSTPTSIATPRGTNPETSLITAPPEGFRAVHMAQQTLAGERLDFNIVIPSDWKADNEKLTFYPPADNGISIVVSSEIVFGNGQVTLDSYVQHVTGNSNQIKIISPSEKQLGPVGEKLTEMANIRIDGKDTRLIFYRTDQEEFAGAFVKGAGNRFWGVGSAISRRTTDEELLSLLNNMEIAMKSFHTTS